MYQFQADQTISQPSPSNPCGDNGCKCNSTAACFTSSFVTLNNSGVQLLEQGRYDDAISCFITASHYFNHIVAVAAQVSQESGCLLYSGAYLSVFSVVEDNESQQVLLLPGGKNPHQQKQYVFQNPIMVSEKAQGNFQTQSSMSYVAAYNLALSYHLSAISKGNHVPDLHQALYYYGLSYKMTLGEGTVIVSQAMILLNNISHIHGLLDNEEGANLCFQYLLSTMLFVQQSGESSRIKNWDSLISNVLDRLTSGIQNPAAAA